MSEGTVVIVDTGQAGTIYMLTSEQAGVILTNGEVWHGSRKLIRLPQGPEDLAAAPLTVERFEGRDKPKRKKRLDD